MLPKRHDLFCSGWGMQCIQFIHVFCKIYNDYYNYRQYICIYVYTHVSVFLYIWYICMYLYARTWRSDDISRIHHHVIIVFSIFPLEIPSRLQKPGIVVLGWPETTENIAANWGLLGKNGQLVLRVVALEAESCGNRWMSPSWLVWDQPRDRPPITSVRTLLMCWWCPCVVFFSPIYIHTTWSLGCSGESLSRLGFTKMKESRRFLFCS